MWALQDARLPDGTTSDLVVDGERITAIGEGVAERIAERIGEPLR